MKYLTLIRHAKSDWGSYADDFHRHLAERGREAAPVMARRLLTELIEPGKLPAPDTLISSPATRAITTARIVAQELDFPVEQIVPEEGIYEASTTRLQEIVRGIDDSVDHAILFGHNPGFDSLARALAADFQGDSGGGFPTCAVAAIKFDTDSWEWIDEAPGELVAFLYPRESFYPRES